MCMAGDERAGYALYANSLAEPPQPGAKILIIAHSAMFGL